MSFVWSSYLYVCM